MVSVFREGFKYEMYSVSLVSKSMLLYIYRLNYLKLGSAYIYNNIDLETKETLYISYLKPSLNTDTKSRPLLLFYILSARCSSKFVE